MRGQKSQLQTECNQEMEKIMKKYESLLQKETCTYHRWTTVLNDNYRKVFMQHSLAENWEKFMKSTPAQGTITSLTFQMMF
jgi:chromodomain-helicase-DNA-binding protein 4